ncbi:MAG: hypothetical protein HY912_22030 [Desulfomonile tiedjei]|uniref:YkgJ family cysteine cluster protein n=1 Tax=Desulfomonile tiedjei TaxID=2358 RepID=A0A9D6V7K4_9BACT|nr:hypothetical protein [Desulfomonile tiedjei]
MPDDIRRDFRRRDALPVKLALLRRVYETYDEVAAGFKSACGMSCATCCTQNVLSTSIEAEFLLQHIESSGGTGLVTRNLHQVCPRRMQPALTINSLVEYCLNSVEIPEPQQEERHTVCPLLENSGCPVYAARPFACRSMWSQETCRPQGEAVMNPILVSVNGVFQQIIEDFDRGGMYGNVLDLLSFLSKPGQREIYLSGGEAEPHNRLLRTVPNPGFPVPPEHRPYVMKWLNRLWERKAAGLPFREAVLKLREMWSSR